MKSGLMKKKYRSLLTAGMIAMLIEYIVLLSDNIIVGQVIGEDGLTATTLVMPFFMLIVFFNMLFVTGTSVSMSTEIGRMNERRANELFSNGTILALITGAAVSIAAIFIKPLFLHVDEVSSEVYRLASSYYNGLIPLPFFMIVNNVLYECITAVGNEKLCVISSVVQVVTNIGLSIALVFTMGIHGVAIATTISTLLALLVLFIQFLRKDNTLKLIWRVSMKDLLLCCRYGFFDASKYLYDTAFTLIMNAVILMKLGESWMPVFCVVVNAQNLLVAAMDGTGNALQPLIGIYEGERNMSGMRRTVTVALKTACVVGLCLTLLMMVTSRLFTQALGITDPIVVQRSVSAIRIVSTGALFAGIMTVISSYYLCRGKIALSCLGPLLQNIWQIVLPVAFLLLIGVNGIWIGMAIAPVMAIALLAWILIKRYGKVQFPYLQTREEAEAWKCLDGRSTPEGIMSIVGDAEKFMDQHNVPTKVKFKAMLVIEECGISIAEINGGKQAAIECSIYIGADILRVILRDDGKRADISDDDRSLSSAQSYFSSRIISGYRQKLYSQATDFNRNVFTISLTTNNMVATDE